VATTTTTLAEFIQSEIGKAVDDEIAQHLFFPGCPLASMIRTMDLTNGTGIAGVFTKYGTLTSAQMTEGQDYVTFQDLDPAGVTVTSYEHGSQSIVTERAWKAIQDPNAREAYAADIARNHLRAIMTEYDVAVMTLLQGLDVDKATTTSDLTNAMVLAAVDAAAKANIPKPWVGILHPEQYSNLLGESGSVWLNAATSGHVGADVYRNYFVGQVYGVEWYVNTNVPTANAAADRGGGIIGPTAFGAVWAKMPITSVEYDQSLRGWEVQTICEWGVAEIDGTMGISLASDA
jgi:hypothetical protein